MHLIGIIYKMTEKNYFSYASYKKALATELSAYQRSRENYESLISLRNKFSEYEDSEFDNELSFCSYNAIIAESKELLAPYFTNEISKLQSPKFFENNAELLNKNTQALQEALPLLQKLDRAQTENNAINTKCEVLQIELAAAKLARKKQEEENLRLQEQAQQKRARRLKSLRNIGLIAVAFFIADHFLLAGYVRSLILSTI